MSDVLVVIIALAALGAVALLLFKLASLARAVNDLNLSQAELNEQRQRSLVGELRDNLERHGDRGAVGVGVDDVGPVRPPAAHHRVLRQLVHSVVVAAPEDAEEQTGVEEIARCRGRAGGRVLSRRVGQSRSIMLQRGIQRS